MPKHRHPVLQVEELEPRLLLSGDLAPWASVLVAPAQLAFELADEHGAAQYLRHELVFVDASVPGAEAWVADLTSSTSDGRTVEVIQLQAGADGLAQISNALRGRTGIDAIHLISHGSPGEVHLGSGILDVTTLDQRKDELRGWQSALSADADLLIYSCDVAANDKGLQLLEGLAKLTTADVAASTDLTGAASMGGNWALEVASGHIETQLAPSADFRARWLGVLTTYSVINTNDSGAGSLRQAIIDANASAGADSITFSIGSGVQTIAVTSALPSVTGTLTIDGRTQPGYAGSPIINITGSTSFNGLKFQGGSVNSAVYGLAIGKFDYGILTTGSSNNFILQNSYIGLEPDGTTLQPNNVGVQLQTSNNTIGGVTSAARNVMAGNFNQNITLAVGSGNSIQGNYIGTDATGTFGKGNNFYGIYLFSSAHGNTIGGSAAGAGNVISGNAYGVSFDSTSYSNTVIGNYIGLTAAGGTATTSWGNPTGVYVTGTSQIIGGLTSAERNIISGHGGTGVGISIVSGTSHQIIGNYIGTDPSGTSPIGNNIGVRVSGSNNIIGGTTAGSGNLISGNSSAMVISGTGNTIAGNRIGTNAAGDADIDGVVDESNMGIDISGNGNTVGGTTAGSGNTIAGLETAINIASDNNIVAGNLLGGIITGGGNLGNYYGVKISGSNNTIGGTSASSTNTIAWNNYGVDIYGSGNTVEGNWIGFLGPAGSETQLGNSTGIRIVGSSNLIGGTNSSSRNVISGNGNGVEIYGNMNVVSANHFGTDISGSNAIENDVGIYVSGDDNLLGGSAAGSRNVISGSDFGVVLDGTDNQVIGNYIGLDSTGTGSVPNSLAGIAVSGSNNIIGTDLYGNVISGNGLYGIWFSGAGAFNNLVSGNLIGLNASGNSAVANGTGVMIENGASGNTIGGTGSSRNVISGNTGGGIVLWGAGGSNRIIGNLIGTDISGTLAIPNYGGIYITVDTGDPSQTQFIGGTAAGEGNLIAYNDNEGVLVDGDARDVVILGNSIHSNGALGIDLSDSGSGLGNGVTPNDAGDADSGPNNNQNFPVLVKALIDNGDLLVVGSLNSTASTTFRIEFFSSPMADASGHGQGTTYLGAVDVTTDASGNATINAFFAGLVVTSGHVITATATSLSGGGTPQRTSEFAQVVTANTSPQITSNGGDSTATVNVAENSTTVTTVTATDADLPAQTLTYSIVGGADAALFAINASTGALSFVTAPDFEVPADSGGNNVYDVTVQASDGVGGTDTQAIAVSVTAVNDNAPVISSNGGGASSSVSVAENSSAVTTVTATDADLPTQTLTYSIVGGADAALFTINTSTGALSFVAAPDFEAPADRGGNNVYDVTVQAADGAGGTDTQAIAVSVIETNDNAPIISSNGGGANSSVNVAENSTAVTTVIAADADLPTQTLTYAIVGGADAALFAINASTGTLSFLTAHDFEAPIDSGGNNVYDVTVQVSDGAGSTDTQAIAISVVPQNDNAPVISSNGGGASSSVTLTENTVAVTTVTATDADLPTQTLTYSIAGGTDAALFAINASTGALSFVTAPDFDAPADSGGNNIYDVIVAASDGAGSTDTQSLTISISALNDNAPIISSNGGGSAGVANVAENSTAVTTVAATDADLPTQTLTYAIVGGADAAHFTIDASTGALSFLAAHDFEAPTDSDGNNVYEVTVQSSDGTLDSAVQHLSVLVMPVNESPVLRSATPSFGVAEGTPLTLQLPPQTFGDPDAGDALTFSVAALPEWLSFDPATATFSGLPTSGYIGSWTMTVRATDAGGLSVDTNITVVVVPALSDPFSTPVAFAPVAVTPAPAPAASPAPVEAPAAAPVQAPMPTATLDTTLDSVMPTLPVIPVLPTVPTFLPTLQVAPAPTGAVIAASDLSSRDAAVPAPAAPLSSDPQEPNFDAPHLSSQPLQADRWRALTAASDDGSRPAHAQLARPQPLAPTEGSDPAVTHLQVADSTISASYIAVSAGVILWSMRASGLLVSVLASMPAWRSLDPLPILADAPDDEGDGDAPSPHGLSTSTDHEDDRLDDIFTSQGRDHIL